MHALVGQSLGNNQAAGGIYGESTRGLDILSMAIENEEIGMIKV
jgi:hypothetical protein